MKYLKNSTKIPPPPSLNLNHSLVIDLTLENLTQVSPNCLSVFFIYYMSTCAFICTYNTDKQYCCEAMCLRLWVTKFCLLCLSVHLCVCLSVSLCLHLFQRCSWLLSHDLTLGNITRGSPVLFVCLPVGCYDNTFRWLPIFSHTLWGISSSPSIINDKNTAPQISTDYLIPSSCLQWPSSEAFSSSKGRGNIIFLLFSFLVLSSPCTFRMWYRFPLEREREKERWRCWDMALKVNEVCRSCFCFPVCVCVWSWN